MVESWSRPVGPRLVRTIIKRAKRTKVEHAEPRPAEAEEARPGSTPITKWAI